MTNEWVHNKHATIFYVMADEVVMFFSCLPFSQLMNATPHTHTHIRTHQFPFKPKFTTFSCVSSFWEFDLFHSVVCVCVGPLFPIEWIMSGALLFRSSSRPFETKECDIRCMHFMYILYIHAFDVYERNKWITKPDHYKWKLNDRKTMGCLADECITGMRCDHCTKQCK